VVTSPGDAFVMKRRMGRVQKELDKRATEAALLGRAGNVALAEIERVRALSSPTLTATNTNNTATRAAGGSGGGSGGGEETLLQRSQRRRKQREKERDAARNAHPIAWSPEGKSPLPPAREYTVVPPYLPRRHVPAYRITPLHPKYLTTAGRSPLREFKASNHAGAGAGAGAGEGAGAAFASNKAHEQMSSLFGLRKGDAIGDVSDKRGLTRTTNREINADTPKQGTFFLASQSTSTAAKRVNQ
jgi:hypothetical protein